MGGDCANREEHEGNWTRDGATHGRACRLAVGQSEVVVTIKRGWLTAAPPPTLS